MKVEIVGGVAINRWRDMEELRERQEEGRAVAARLFPSDKVWENRVIQLAQTISTTHWKLVRKLPRKKLQTIIEGMMSSGFPGDVPYDSMQILTDEGLGNQNVH
jgi:hypothetical protein